MSAGQGRLLQIDLGGFAAGGCRSPGPEGREPRAQPALISTGRGLINPRPGLPGGVRIMETGRAPGGASGAVGGAGPGASPSRARAEAGRGVRGGAQPPRALSAAGRGSGRGAGGPGRACGALGLGRFVPGPGRTPEAEIGRPDPAARGLPAPGPRRTASWSGSSVRPRPRGGAALARTRPTEASGGGGWKRGQAAGKGG